MLYKTRELGGISRCKLRRSRNLDLNNGIKNTNYEKATVIKREIKNGLETGFDENTVKDNILKAFNAIDFPTEETKKAQAEDAWAQTMRYLNSEKRIAEVNNPTKVIDLGFGLEVEVRPDLIFRGTKTFTVEMTNEDGKKEKIEMDEPYIEIVSLRCSLPDVSLRGRKMDHGAMQSLWLYALLKYGRELIKPNETINIGASFYFMRTSQDSKMADISKQDYFSFKEASITIWERHDAFLSPEAQAMDDNFKPQVEVFVNGMDECSPEDCKKCVFDEKCNHSTKPPKYIEIEKEPRKLQDLIFSDEQEKVVYAREGIMRVNAGAGSGKTTVSAANLALKLSEGADPKKMLVITFSDTATCEIKERIQMYSNDLGVGDKVDDVTITTFHGFGYNIIKENYEKYGFSKEPMLLKNVARSKIIEQLLRDYTVRGLDYKNFRMDIFSAKGALATAKNAFEVIKEKRLSLGDESILASNMSVSIKDRQGYSDLLTLYNEYEDILRDKCLLEYPDLEILLLELLEKEPYFFDTYGFENVLIDEFQDTNETQFKILQKIIDTKDFKHLLVVGDDSQAIFRFRGCSPQFIIDFFDKLEEEGTDIYMTENYRSTSNIINFANKVIDLNTIKIDKELIPMKPAGKPVECNCFLKKAELEQFVVDEMKKQLDSGIKLEDIAYIASTRKELLDMGTKCTEAGIPWIMLNPEPMLENSRVLGAIHLCEVAKDSTNKKAAFNYLNIKNDNQLLENYSDDEIEDMISQLITELVIVKSDNNLEEFKKYLTSLNEEDEIYESFLEELFGYESIAQIIDYAIDYELYGENEAMKRNRKYPGVVLTTAHSSKGMEFSVVINNISKYDRQGLSRRDDIEEKRRLLFVSSTRAKEQLIIIGLQVSYKANQTAYHNRFLKEVFNILDKEFTPEQPKKGAQ